MQERSKSEGLSFQYVQQQEPKVGMDCAQSRWKKKYHIHSILHPPMPVVCWIKNILETLSKLSLTCLHQSRYEPSNCKVTVQSYTLIGSYLVRSSPLVQNNLNCVTIAYGFRYTLFTVNSIRPRKTRCCRYS